MQPTARFFPRDGRFWLIHLLCWWLVIIAFSKPSQMDGYTGVAQLYSWDLVRFLVSIPVLLVFRYCFLRKGWQTIKWPELICLILGFNFVSALFICALIPSAVSPSNVWFEILQRESVSIPRELDEAVVSFFYSFILQSLWCVCYVLAQRDKLSDYFHAHSDSLQRELKATKSQALHQQISPHFLFNGLNNVCSLIDEDAEKAQVVLRNLAQILRFNMNVDQHQSLSLDEELNFLSYYVSICELQYEKRLRFFQSVDKAVLEYCLPSLAIQTLVENAIKHGVARSQRVTNVGVDVSQAGSFVEVAVSNTGILAQGAVGEVAGNNISDVRQGVGLRNLRERLNIFFGESASLSLSQCDDEVLVVMRFPKRKIKNTADIPKR